MAQTGYTPLQIYSSSTGGNAPAAGNLTNSTLGSELAINITDGKLFYKDNAGVVQVIAWKTTPTTAGGTGLTSYAAGDLLYYATGTALSKLAIGASTNILTSSGSAPQWTAPSTITVGKATNLDGGAAGSVPYQSGAGATTFLAIGAANRVLTSSGSAPQWSTSLVLAGTVQANSYQLNTTQNVISGGMWYQTSGAKLVWTPPSSGGFKWNNSSNTVEIASLSDAGAFTLADNLIVGTSGKGIDFSATPGTGTSELLNDYEEGTWTPVPTSSAGTITSYTSSGRYTKVGRAVVLSFQITITNNGTGSGIVLVTGVPFAATAVNLESGSLAEVAVIGFSGYVVFNTTTRLSLGKYDNTYPGGTNYVLVGQITYQV